MIDVVNIPSPEAANASTIYAVGDIHGRLDLLEMMEDHIAADILDNGVISPLLCYLGDYIDRGPQSAQVIDHLSKQNKHGLARVFLKGNHEDRMIEFLDNPSEKGPSWISFGGHEALESYGLAVPADEQIQWDQLRDQLKSALPDRHLQFLKDLRIGFRWGSHLFVHAGLNPDRTTADQLAHDLMWIREPFLSSDTDWGMTVVHGHVIVPEPVFRANRIGIDTGAYRTGELTCLVVSQNAPRLLRAMI